MKKSKWALMGLSILLGFSATITLFLLIKRPVLAAEPADLPAADSYILLSWNDLGMHCYNRDFQDLAVLPPFNTLWAQVVKRGDPPSIITTGITVTYVFTDNTYSVGKSNFWTYAQQLFSLPAPLPDNIGLTGKGLAGNMDLSGDHYEAVGIPLTEYSDSAPTVRDPYQLATVTILSQTTGITLTQARVVAPVSTEMRCDECHSDTGIATIESGITPTGKVETNILTQHDQEHIDDYPVGHTGALMSHRPVLCASCHSSNALGEPGVAGLPSLSRAMHEKHSEEDDFPTGTDGCYKCHPGPETRCLRDIMSEQYGLTCTDCHGDLADVAQNPDPWLNEPRCDTCHSNIQQDQPLYRLSKSHGGIACEACHDSTHAIALSREPRDAIKFIELQGHAGTLDTCTVCHLTQPIGPFQHAIDPPKFHLFLPLVNR